LKLLRFNDHENIKTGYLNENMVVELDLSMKNALESSDKLINHEIDKYPLNEVRISAPVSPSKIICVGLNYRDHARELNMEIPDEPVIFIKPPTSVIGHQEDIINPPMSNEVDYEAELAVIISKEAKNVSIDEAQDYIGGYTILNDVTARDLQRKDGQWTRAKSFDTFCPIGPFIETDIDPNKQNISSKLNNEIKQDSNTKNMIFKVEDLVEFISHIMTLNPGDVIATGTPPGVGSMDVGDVLKIEIDKIGILENKLSKL
jgi:2-keto-4-pentenoate hydratase/2-oxohepta-3-ene-1,7-dioic acid hydratase in catechol pathway